MYIYLYMFYELIVFILQVGRLQEILNFNYENILQNPTILPEPSLNPLQIESADIIENVPVQRPKRKIQRKLLSNTNKTINSEIQNNVT